MTPASPAPPAAPPASGHAQEACPVCADLPGSPHGVPAQEAATPGQAAGAFTRWFRFETPNVRDATIALASQQTDSGEREFWQSLDALAAEAARYKAERDAAREELATCRERNAAIAVQLDQYRDERDDYRAALHSISSRMPIGRHASPDECDAMRAIARAALEATP